MENKMTLMRVNTEVNVVYNTHSNYGHWYKKGRITGIDDTGIMVRETEIEYFIPWNSVVHVELS